MASSTELLESSRHNPTQGWQEKGLVQVLKSGDVGTHVVILGNRQTSLSFKTPLSVEQYGPSISLVFQLQRVPRRPLSIDLSCESDEPGRLFKFMFSTELHAVKVDSLRARLPLAFIDEDQWYTIWFDVTELMNYCFHEQLTRITAIKIEQGARLRRVLSLGGSRHLPAKWALPATLNANEVKINALVLADLEAARASATGLDLTTSMLMDRSDGTIIAGRLPAPPSSGSNSRPARSPRRGRMVRSGDKAGRPVRDSVKWPVHETATSGVKPSGQEQRGANDGMERGDSRHVNSHIVSGGSKATTLTSDTSLVDGHPSTDRPVFSFRVAPRTPPLSTLRATSHSLDDSDADFMSAIQVARAPESRPASDTPPTDSSAGPGAPERRLGSAGRRGRTEDDLLEATADRISQLRQQRPTSGNRRRAGSRSGSRSGSRAGSASTGRAAVSAQEAVLDAAHLQGDEVAQAADLVPILNKPPVSADNLRSQNAGLHGVSRPGVGTGTLLDPRAEHDNVASQGVLVGAAMSAAAGAVNEDEEDEEGQRPTFTSSSLLASRAPSDAATSLLEDLVRQGLQVETGPGLLDLSGFKVAEEDFLVDDTWRYEDDDEDKSRKEHGVADVQRDDLDSDEDLPLASRPMHRSSHDTISLDDGDGNGGEALSAGLRRGLKQPSSSRGSTTMSTSGEGHALTPRPTGLQRRESDVASTRSSVTVAAQARLSLANVHGGEDDVVLRRQDNIGTPNPGHLHATDLMWEDDWDTRWSPEPSHLDSSDSEDEDQASSLFDSDMRRRAGSLSELESSFSSVGRSISRTADASLREVIYDPGLNCYYDPATNQYFQLA